MMQLLAGAGPGQGQLLPGKSWSRPRLWPNSCAIEEATPRTLAEWSWRWGGDTPGPAAAGVLLFSPHLPLGPSALPRSSPAGHGRGPQVGVPREGGHHSSGHIIQPCPHASSSGVGHSVGASVTPWPPNWVALTWKWGGDLRTLTMFTPPEKAGEQMEF